MKYGLIQCCSAFESGAPVLRVAHLVLTSVSDCHPLFEDRDEWTETKTIQAQRASLFWNCLHILL